MAHIPYLTDGSLATVRAIEQELGRYAESGVLFVSVSPELEIDGELRKMDVLIGVGRQLETQTAEILAGVILQPWSHSYTFQVKVRRGISCVSQESSSSSSKSDADEV